MTDEEVRLVLDGSRRRRPLRVLAYLLIGLAGVVLVYDPTRSLADETPAIRWAWGSFLVAGAALSVFGAFRDKWVIEWAGIPLLGTALAALAYILIRNGNTGGLAFGALTLAQVVVLISRGWDLWILAGATLRAGKDETRRADG